MINLIDICKDAQKIGISGHTNPDGDCVGSTMAVWQFLKKVYPEKIVEVRIEEPPKSYGVVKGISEIVYSDEKTHYDVFIVCDSVPEKDRIGAAYEYFCDADIKVNIDHHVTNTGVGDFCYMDPDASSASELCGDLIRFADPEEKYMDADIATALYFGIIQDCGVFQYSCTSPKTLQMAAWLIGFGFDFSKIITETFYEKSYDQTKLLGFAIDECKLYEDGKVCFVFVDLEDMERLHVGSADFDGVSTQLRYIRGVEVAGVFKQVKDRSYKLSARSANYVDVAKVCAAFSGGGHVRAAGATFKGNRDDIVDAVLAEIRKQL